MSYILVDLGYLSFYRYHAAKKWLSFQHEMNQENPWQNEERFRQMLLKQYEKNLKSYMKKGTMIMAMESLDGKNWRKTVYSEYKAQRPKNNDIYSYFKYLTNTFLPNFVKNNPQSQLVRKPCTEADDIIATEAMKLAKNISAPQIQIVTSDMDFLQLVEKDNTIRLYDANFKLKSEKPVIGQEYLRKKIIHGDSSDNIKPVHSGKGTTKIKQTLVSYLNSVQNLDDVEESVFENVSKGSYEKFLLNRKLIDFKMIPCSNV